MNIDKPLTYSMWRYMKKHNLDGSVLPWRRGKSFMDPGFIWAPYIPVPIIAPIIDETWAPTQPLRSRYQNLVTFPLVSRPSSRFIADDLVPVQPLSAPSMLPIWMDFGYIFENNKWDFKKPITFKSWRRVKEIKSRYSIKPVNQDYYGLIDIESE